MIGETPVAAAAPAQRRLLRDSVLFKMFVIGLLMLALLIPLVMVSGLISERQARHDQTAAEVAKSWGMEQTLGGPVLRVPYLVHGKDADGKSWTATLQATFLPEQLAVDGQVVPEKRSRGIFEVAVYRAHLNWKGTFRRPSFAAWGVAEQDVRWNEAELSFGVPDMRGLRHGVRVTWAGQGLDLAPGGSAEGMWSRGLRTPVPGLAGGEAGQTYPFAFDLVLDGSRSLKFLPLGRQTTVKLRSPWPDPSFTGAYLPESRRVGKAGFEAAWSVPYFGRSYPQQWRLAEEAAKVAPQEALDASAFGVDLFLPVDAYQKTERSLKYGMLFLLLTFLTFFLYEVFNPFSLHPLQYLLVGAALVLFYLLLLSLSEHVPFGLAYAVASAATVGLIGGYAAAILRGRMRALGTAAALAALYGYLYVLLQAEDYALLLGSVGLFAILALVMFVTRRIDWYAPRPGGGSPSPGRV
ncbi:MAG TPA: cell envelope integrity protein CreD [Thermoanaerobaculia bacterium]|nr:cell envelope integrity protein CreD [Thermoanaerobaculia bacterium]